MGGVQSAWTYFTVIEADEMGMGSTMNGESLGVRANYVARIRGSQGLDYRLSVLSQSWQGMPKAAVVPQMPFGFSSCAILRWEIPDLSMIYVLETSKRKTHQIDCPQHMSLAQTDSSILARTPQQTYHPKTSIDLPRQRRSPERDKLFGSSKDIFLVPGTLRF